MTLDAGVNTLPAQPGTGQGFGPAGWSALPAVSVIGNRWVLATTASTLLPVAVNGRQARWLRATLPVEPPALQISAALDFAVNGAAAGALVGFDAAYSNSVPLDFTRDVLPFGERPRLSDTFFFPSDAAFAGAGTRITIAFTFTKPAGGVKTSTDLVLNWEAWDGRTATLIGTTSKTTAVGVTDTTAALSVDASGSVSFTLPTAIPRSKVGAVTSRDRKTVV